ncbi:MAG: HigA family addiction module antitoxin [Vicinamibacterales bacterium]
MPTKSGSKTITRDINWLGPAIPPGEILLEEYLKPLGVGQIEAARKLGISLNRLNEIVLGKRSITADTALRLGRFLKTSPQLWMRLQADWDLHQAMLREDPKAS